ncbi:Ribosome-binding ATPase YchF [Candidatus Annandia adelgestsuga]|uniref:Ribosome-binding ATPase YchF n=1 Tax=Candidatus Annandia adelgestsuga TaxID=1302411 RepID=A0A3S9J7W6_9ENTR|nr:redox-regulated ATPase YchF [Candidatus Annandia adelgestsuga]AZP36367.1 Ribosome-binding ATPase YchF [Candidatus Annandia adelgestsuga]
MGLKCGILGLPNIGKSTIFNVLTKSKAMAANFPFCTIKPNIGFSLLPDNRLIEIQKIVNSKKITPTNIKFIDIAGLVKGASSGNGLGNKFLNDVRSVNILIHVVRFFKDQNIQHIYNRIDPIKDINIINDELIISDIELCEKNILYLNKKNKNYKNNKYLLETCLYNLENGLMLNNIIFKKEETKYINSINFLTSKPMMYVINSDKNFFKNDKIFKKLKKKFIKKKNIFINICAKTELEISEINNYEKKKKKLFELKLKESKLNKLITYSFKLLNMHTYFTVGKKEICSRPILIGTNALESSKKIHTDFKKGFIRAKVISYKDFIKYNGENGVKKMGKIKLEGKKYVIKDGDIIQYFFKI